MYVYSLTNLTGRRKDVDRSMVVATVEVKRFTFLVLIGSVAASIPFAALVGMMLGKYAAVALAVPPLFMIAGHLLVDQRTKKGLQLRRYEAMWDKRKARKNTGTVYVCSEPMRPAVLGNVIQTVIPNPHHSEGADPLDPATLPRTAAAGIGRTVRRSGPADRSFLL